MPPVMNKSKKIAIRTTLATSSTLATILGAQMLAMQQFGGNTTASDSGGGTTTEPINNSPQDTTINAVPAGSAEQPTLPDTTANTLPDQAADIAPIMNQEPEIIIPHEVPSVVILRNPAEVSTAQQPQIVPPQPRLVAPPQPIVVQPDPVYVQPPPVIVQAPPQNNGGGHRDNDNDNDNGGGGGGGGGSSRSNSS